jgi:L-histidine Nalpha-methyltransferase
VTYAIDVHLGPADLDAALRADVRQGLGQHPLVLAPKWFYDDLGSRLFDAITALAEYYPTRCETAILRARAAEIARTANADTLVELGSGTSTKTAILLDALGAGERDARRPGHLRRFVPLDVSESTLRAAAGALTARYPGLEVHAVVGDFEHHLPKLPSGDRRLVAFLGGTIGNLAPDQRAAFLEDLGGVLEPGDQLLLGTDLVKDRRRLLAAYDDPAGVTAAFNRNVLSVLNARMAATFDVRAFVHEARWNEHEEWIEMHLRAEVDQQIHIGDLALDVALTARETIRTEISAKFRREGVEKELADAGLLLKSWWTDDRQDFGVSLSVRT